MHVRQEFGALAERLAEMFLTKHDYQILERNYRKPWGEIDIIAKMEDTLVFIEVKASSGREQEAFAPQLRADSKKLRKVVKSAMLYLEFELRDLESEWRVDIIAVHLNHDSNKAKITHFKNVGTAIE